MRNLRLVLCVLLAMLAVPLVSASDRVVYDKGPKQTATLSALRQFSLVTTAIYLEKIPNVGSNVEYYIVTGDAGEVVEVSGVVTIDGVGHLFIAELGERGFVITQHRVTAEEGGVAEVVDANTICYPFQNGQNVRIVCLCRKSVQESFRVCSDTGWIAQPAQ